MQYRKRLIALMLVIVTGLLAACDLGSGGGPSTTPGAQTGNKPANAIEVSIIYAPESALYMPRIIQSFNDLSAQGKNPVTGQAYASGEKPIWITDPTNGAGGSSGTVMQGIINAIIAPNNANVPLPFLTNVPLPLREPAYSETPTPPL